MKILITGAAGFIGSNLCMELVKNKKFKIVGIDNLNDYYDVNLKKDRLKKIIKDSKKNFKFLKVDISNEKKLFALFKKFRFEIVINLAAQAGVRYSLKNPREYIKSNINGFYNVLELSKKFEIKHLIYASTSSVYGKNDFKKLKETNNTDNPLQLYAATKKSNELMAHAYSHLFNLNTTGLRFFTVYGEWGRPDMALFIFVKNILKNKNINVFNKGNHYRDFTYVGDVVKSINLLIIKKPKKKFNIYNISNSKPISLINFISLIEQKLIKKGKKNYKPIQKGDVFATNSNANALYNFIKYKPNTKIKDGIASFINWYRNYYK